MPNLHAGLALKACERLVCESYTLWASEYTVQNSSVFHATSYFSTSDCSSAKSDLRIRPYSQIHMPAQRLVKDFDLSGETHFDGMFFTVGVLSIEVFHA